MQANGCSRALPLLSGYHPPSRVPARVSPFNHRRGGGAAGASAGRRANVDHPVPAGILAALEDPGEGGGAAGETPSKGPKHEFAAFEKHGKGVASKLMAKWGFAGEGSGIGKRETGRAEPLTASLRPRKQGLGA